MKKLIIAAVFSLGFITATNAQQRGDFRDKDPQERAKMMAENLQKKLNLTDTQEEQVYQAFLARAGKMKDRKPGENFDREKMKAQNEAFDKELEKIFNAEQKEKYKEMKSQMLEKAKQRGPGKGNRSEKKEG